MIQQWYHCYNDSWQGVITPDAFAHPAKFARGLIRRIYQYMLDSGYLAPGDSVIDPFGGVGLGGLDAMTFGLHWTGVELEPRFVALGNANIDKWRVDLAMINGTLGTARLLQGDSRRLVEVVGAGMAGVVSSPPWEAGLDRDGRAASDLKIVQDQAEKQGRIYTDRSFPGSTYGSDPANIGNDNGDNFWSAARLIVEQTYQALKPGGYAAWVTKRFVRKGQIVEFSEQWAQLCEAVGFERIEWVRAMLVEDHGDQLDIFGGMTARGKERKSFFRRLAEKKGSPRIDYEDVVILRKPKGSDV